LKKIPGFVDANAVIFIDQTMPFSLGVIALLNTYMTVLVYFRKVPDLSYSI